MIFCPTDLCEKKQNNVEPGSSGIGIMFRLNLPVHIILISKEFFIKNLCKIVNLLFVGKIIRLNK